MTKKIIYLFALIGIMAFSSCEKFLDVKPINEKPFEISLNNQDAVYAVLMSAYDQIQGGNFYGGNLQKVGELYGDNLDFDFVQGRNLDFELRNFDLFFNPASGTWDNAYRAIGRSNLVIKSIDENYFEAEQITKDQLRGEALFIRAIAHFEVCRIFSLPYSFNPDLPGIIIRNRFLSTDETQNYVPWSSIRETYAQSISDLELAITLLPADVNAQKFGGNTHRGRASQLAAKAFLARIYFDMNDFVKAEQYANDVISNGGLSMASGSDAPLAPFYNEGQTVPKGGVVWQIVNKQGDDGSGTIRSLFWNAFPAFVQLSLDKTGPNSIYETLKTQGGARFDSLVADNATRPMSRKFRGADPEGFQPTINIPILRLAEMHLVRAECKAQRSASDAEVRADINAIRAVNALPADNTTAGKDNLLAKIRQERRMELVVENDRWHELRRLKLPCRGFAYDSKLLILTPTSESNGNTDLKVKY